MAPSCASTVPLQVVTTLAVARPLGSGADAAVESVVAAASLGTEASLPVDMPGGREGLEGDTDAQGSARRRSGLAHTSTRRVATPRFPASKSGLGPPLFETAWQDAARATPRLAGRFAVLNVSFLDMRSDGHVATSMRYSSSRGEGGPQKATFPLDCLHYCYPGPADFWALALYNLLRNNERYARS